MSRGSIGDDRWGRSRLILKDDPSHRVPRQGDLCQRATGQKQRSHRPGKGGNEFWVRSEFRDPDPSGPGLLISVLIYIAACLHAASERAFPRAFRRQARKFPATLIYLARDRLHDTFFSVSPAFSLFLPTVRLLRGPVNGRW